MKVSPVGTLRRTLAAAVIGAAVLCLAAPGMAADEPPIKIGVLHSLSGTMAISEVSLRDVVLMAVDEINAKGGVCITKGDKKTCRKIEPVVVDPASNWDLFAEKAKQLLLQDKVAVTFGCWTSVSRKSVLPVFEGNNGFEKVHLLLGREVAILRIKRPGLDFQNVYQQGASILGAQGMVQGHKTLAQNVHVLDASLDLLVQEFRILFQVDPVGKIIVDNFFLDLNP